MPHVEILHAQLQKRQLCPTIIKEDIQKFIQVIDNVKDKVPDILTNN